MPPISVCPSLLATGACMDTSCAENHDVYVCVPCGIVVKTERFYDAHLNGIRHRKKVAGAGKPLRCPLCEVVVSGGLRSWQQHANGKKHQAVALRLGVSPDVDPEEAGGNVLGHVFCSVCETYIQDYAWQNHFGGRGHAMKLKFGAMRSAFQEAAKDKHGVTVSFGEVIDFGVLDNTQGTCRGEVVLEIRSTVPSSSIILLEAKLSIRRSQQSSP